LFAAESNRQLARRSVTEYDVPYDYDDENIDDGTNFYDLFSGMKMQDSLLPTINDELVKVPSTVKRKDPKIRWQRKRSGKQMRQ
jgi:hypothetical protein